MKVSSSITIAPSDCTGLPSLLSSEADLLLPVDGMPVVPSKDSSSDPATSAFDAVLAMLCIPPNPPLPPVTTPTPVATNEVINPAAPAIVVPVPAMPLAAAMTTAANIASPSTGFAVPPSPAASTSTEPESAGTKKSPDPLSPAISLTQPPLAKFAGSGPIPSTTEQKPEATSPPNIEQTPASESLNAPPKLSTPAETIEISRKKPDELRESSGQKAAPHRHVTIDGRLMVEGTNQPPHTVEPTSNMPLPTNSESLASSLATAFQTQHDELVAGQPIELQLRLDPPELGMVRVHLRLTDDVVSIRFIAGDEAATRMLESQLPDLRQSLAERGLAFTQCDVICDSRQQQSSDFQQGANRTLFAPTRLAPRAWTSVVPVIRSNIARGDRLDVLA